MGRRQCDCFACWLSTADGREKDRLFEMPILSKSFLRTARVPCRGDYEQLRVWFVVVAVLVGDASWNLKRRRLECKPTQDKNKRDAEVRMTGEINRFTVRIDTW